MAKKNTQKKVKGIQDSGIALITKDAWGKEDDLDINPPNLSLQIQYRNAYDNFPLVQQCINKTKEDASQDFHFEGPNEDKLNELKNKMNLVKKSEEMILCLLKSGNVWAEVLGDENNPTGLKLLDPTTMTTITKKTGKILAHIQQIGDKKYVWGKVDKRMTAFGGKIIKRRPLERMLFMKINVQAGEKYGTPFTHAVLPMLKIKEQIESDLKVVVRRYIAPIIHAQVGDELHPPDDEDINAVSSSLEDIYSKTEYTTNYLVKMNVLGFNGKGIDIDPVLKHIDNQIIIGLGLYPEIIGGVGGDKALAEVRLRAYGRHIKSIQKQFKTEFEDKFIVGLGLGTYEDQIVFEPADERERIEEIKSIMELVKARLISPELANRLLPHKFLDKEWVKKTAEEAKTFQQMNFKLKSDRQVVGNKFDNPNDPTRQVDKKGFRTQKDETISGEKKKNGS